METTAWGWPGGKWEGTYKEGKGNSESGTGKGGSTRNLKEECRGNLFVRKTKGRKGKFGNRDLPQTKGKIPKEYKKKPERDLPEVSGWYAWGKRSMGTALERRKVCGIRRKKTCRKSTTETSRVVKSGRVKKSEP